jgi:DUF1680 family protein
MNLCKRRLLARIAGLACTLICLQAALRAQAQNPSWQSQGTINDASSPQAKLHSVPIRAVQMGEGFWSARMRTNLEQSIPTMLQLLEEHGVVDNFRRLSGRKVAARRGPVYTDSDVYKWMEAASYVLQSGDQPQLHATLDKLIDDVLAAQEPSGYLNTYYVGDRAKLRFAEMYRSHELYCLGHLLQAGIAYYRATGNRKLLDGGMKFANYLVEKFGPEKKPALTGHPELEMALVELYRTTGDRHYLDFAGYLLTGEKLRLQLTDAQVSYMFSGIPFTERTELEGHAVRALYACSGATDYYLETGDANYFRTLNRLWQDLVEHRLYITGGVGSEAEQEAIGPAYDLPNERAYAESCAAIANLMWNWRMLAATADARFADIMERALYNGINSGMSISGTLYCYRNPLESRGGGDIRQPWYDTTCCPPNLERTFASIPGYLYATSPSGVYVNLYHTSTLNWRLEDGNDLKLTQETGYPWRDSVTITVTPAKPSRFGVLVRVPGWSRKARVTVNGKPAPGTPKPGEYFALQRDWKPGDSIGVQFDMTPLVIAANPRVREDLGRVAVQRGPLVYCLEQVDQMDQESVFDVALPLGPDPSKGFTTQFQPETLGGILVLRHKGIATPKPFAKEPLYMPAEGVTRQGGKEVDLTFIPYYAWANRLPGPMEVWIPYTATASGSPSRRKSSPESNSPE